MTASTADEASLDIFWLRDESLEDSSNLPAPDVLAQEIVDDPEAALELFRKIALTSARATLNIKRVNVMAGARQLVCVPMASCRDDVGFL